MNVFVAFAAARISVFLLNGPTTFVIYVKIVKSVSAQRIVDGVAVVDITIFAGSGCGYDATHVVVVVVFVVVDLVVVVVVVSPSLFAFLSSLFHVFARKVAR